MESIPDPVVSFAGIYGSITPQNLFCCPLKFGVIFEEIPIIEVAIATLYPLSYIALPIPPPTSSIISFLPSISEVVTIPIVPEDIGKYPNPEFPVPIWILVIIPVIGSIDGINVPIDSGFCVPVISIFGRFIGSYPLPPSNTFILRIE